jgi:hypothetical protein
MRAIWSPGDGQSSPTGTSLSASPEPSGIRSVACPIAPSVGQLAADSPPSHHGCRWSEHESPSKPARSAATACSS